jgi:hypothetical protein
MVILNIYSHFGMLCKEKSGNPDFNVLHLNLCVRTLIVNSGHSKVSGSNGSLFVPIKSFHCSLSNKLIDFCPLCRTTILNTF